MVIKRFVVDMLALNVFIIFTAFIVEVIFSGVPLDTYARGRLILIIPNIITVVPYNRTRQWIGAKLGAWKSARLQQIIRDTIVFIIYRVPLVFIVLTVLGLPFHQVIVACGLAALIAGFTGRPYGLFLDWMRGVFKVQ